MSDFLQTAIKRAGGLTKLGKALGVTRQAVKQWKKAPPEQVLKIEKLTGISRHDLRPDVFGKAPREKKRKCARPKTSVPRTEAPELAA